VLDLAPIKYTKVGSESIAYRDCGGDGPALVYVGTYGSHQDLMWEEPGYAHFLRTLVTLGRLVTFDRRGSGLSSHTSKPTIETRVADIGFVLDATGIDDAVLVGAGGACQTALAFCAMQPDRTRALVLYSPVARVSRADDFPIGVPREITEGSIELTESTWGTGITALIYAPSLADDPHFVEWAGRMERSTATPLEAREWVEMYDEADVRAILGMVNRPALVVTPALAGDFAPDLSRFVADQLSDALALEIAARDQWPFGDGMAAFVDALSAFLVGVGEIEVRPSSRRLAAVLFTDLVDSTEHLREVGDQRWTTTLDSHDDLTRRAVSRSGGRVVKSTGDGVLAVFDGPVGAVMAALDVLGSLPRIGLEGRAGVHMGEIEERGDDISGLAVNLSSRIVALAAPNQVLVSSTVRDLVAGSGLGFDEQGAFELKGIDQPVSLLSASLG
jgi:class 3 adenylate cyclase